MCEDYVDEYGLDLYDHVDIGGLLCQTPGDASVPVLDRDDINEWVPVSDENYIKLLKKLREDVDKKLEEFK